MPLPEDLAAYIQAVDLTDHPMTPQEELQEGDELLGTLDDEDLKKIYLFYMSLANNEARVGWRRRSRHFFEWYLARMFPGPATRIGAVTQDLKASWHWGLRKNWQIVIYPYKLPRLSQKSNPAL